MKTTWLKEKDIKRKWYLVDVEGQVLGRVATVISSLLIGKGKPNRVPNMDCGDYVIVINSAKVDVTGKKETDKIYYRHSQHPGGLKEESLGDLRKRNPNRIIERAVRNMLPNTKLRRGMMKRFFVYEGKNHDHEAQKPEPVDLKSQESN